MSIEEENINETDDEVVEEAVNDLSYREKSLREQCEKSRKKMKRAKSLIFVLIFVLVLLVLALFIANTLKDKKDDSTSTSGNDSAEKVMKQTETPVPTASPVPTDTPTPTLTPIPTPKYKLTEFTKTDKTIELASAPEGDNRFDLLELTPLEDAAKPYTEGEDITKTKMVASNYIVLADADTGEIIVERDADKVVYPASMTKVLTVLTAMDYITEDKLNDHVFVCQETMDYVYKNDCSRVGFVLNQEVCVKDLIYGTIVCSGGDAALELAKYCCGSVDAFVEQMNKKVEEMGLSETAHFTNPVGIFNEDLHCRVKDIGIIMCAAMQNELLKDVLKTRIYTTTVFTEDEEIQPLELSNWFIRRIEDKETNGTIVGAKTGFVNQSRNCAVSYMISDSGKNYVCVTGMANSAWRAIYDHVALYRSFTK